MEQTLQKQILCADIGGTHSRFAHFELENGNIILKNHHICPTANLASTEDLLDSAMSTGLDPYKAHLNIWGIAGPIEENGLQASLTNAPLRLDFSFFANNIKNPFLLVNDFTLQAWASVAENCELTPIINKQIPLRATRAILGAGTGLGTAALIPVQEKSWSILQAEGGHTEMPFNGKDELDFANFALKHLHQDRLSAEDILSARGISLLHHYVFGKAVSPAEAAQGFISNNEESLQLQLYAKFLGRFCRHWALNTLCMGGLFLGGGVLIKNPNILMSKSFTQEFYAAPKSMQGIINNIPIMLMTSEFAGLWGAAHAAKMMLAKQ